MALFATDLRTHKLRLVAKISEPEHTLWAQAEFEYNDDDADGGVSEQLSVFAVGGQQAPGSIDNIHSSLYFFSITQMAPLEVDHETKWYTDTILEIKYLAKLKLLFVGGENGIKVLQLARSRLGKYSTKQICGIDIPQYDVFVLEPIMKNDTTIWIAFAGSDSTIRFIEATLTHEAVSSKVKHADFTVNNSSDAPYGFSIKTLFTLHSPNSMNIIPYIRCLNERELVVVDGEGHTSIWNMQTQQKLKSLKESFPLYMHTYEQQFVVVLGSKYLTIYDTIHDELVFRYEGMGFSFMGADLSVVASYVGLLDKLLGCAQKKQFTDLKVISAR